MASKVFMRKSSGLVRQATLLDTFLFNSAASAMGSAIVMWVFNITWLPGGDMLAAIPFLLPAFSIAIVYAFLTSTMPRSGGDYVFNSRILHPSLGFSFNFALVAFQSIYLAFTFWWIWESGLGPGLGLASYVTGVPSLFDLGVWIMQPVNSLILGTILNIFFVGLAVAGTKHMLRILNVMYIFGLIGILLAIITMALTSNSQFVTLFNNFISSTDSQLKSSPNAYQATIELAAKNNFTAPPLVFVAPMVPVLAGNVIWTFYSTYFAGEIKGADSLKRNIISMFGATIFNLVLLTLFVYTFFHTVGYEFISALTYLSWSPGTLPTGWGVTWVPNFFFGLVAPNPIISIIIILGLTFSQTLIYAPVLVMQIQRNLFGWSVDRLLPDKISEVSPRYHSPVWAIIASAVIVEAILIGLIVGYTIDPSILTPYMMIGVIGPATACMLLPGFTAIVLPWRKKQLYEGSPAKMEIGRVPVIAIFGVIEIAFMLFLLYEFLAWPGFGLSDPIFTILTFGFFVAGFFLFWIIRAIRKRQGIDIDLAFREIPPL
jgi:APA family basic amino acid/polyamine antiporter